MPRKPAAPPDTTSQGGRLRFAREDNGYSSPRAAAKNFGWNEETYRSHEGRRRGKEGLKVDDIKKYAKAYGYRPEWIALGTGKPKPDRDLTDLPAADQAFARRLYDVANANKG